MSSWLRERAEVVRAVGFAVWSWVVIASVLSLTITLHQGTSVVISQRAGAVVTQQARTGPDVAVSFFDVFFNVLTFDFGRSFLLGPGVSAWSVVMDPTIKTVTFLALVLVFVTVFALPLVALSRRGNASVTGLLGYVGVVPAVGWLVVFFFLGDSLAPSLLGNPARSTSALVLPAVALALPLAGAIGRIVAQTDGRPSRGDSRHLILEAWFWVNWVVGATIAVELLYGIPGVGAYWLNTLQQGDLPVFLAATAVLTLPLLALSVVRELAFGRFGGETSNPTVTPRGSLDTDGGANLLSVGGVLRENRQVQVGLVTFAVLLVAGLVGSTVASLPKPVTRGEVQLAYLAMDLGAVTLVTTVGTLVGGLVGVSLGVASSQFSLLGTLGRLVTDAAMNVPVVVFVVVAFLLLGLFGHPSPLVAELGVGFFAGLALAGVTLRVTEWELDRGDDVATAVVSAAGTLMTSAVVLAFLVAELAVVGFFPAVVGQSWVLGRGFAATTVGIVVAVSLPSLALLVLGDGLRRAVSAEYPAGAFE